MKRSAVIFWALLLFCFVYSFPYFPKIHSANELPRVYLTDAVVETGEFHINDGVSRFGATVDVSPDGNNCRPRRHNCYSNKAPGSSFVAAPGYLLIKRVYGLVGAEFGLAEMVWACRFFGAIVPMFLFLGLLSRFLSNFLPTNKARGVIVVYALGSMAMTYSVTFFAHQLSAACLGSAMIFLYYWKQTGKKSLPFFIGIAGASAIVVDYQAAFGVVPLGVWFLVIAYKRKSLPLGCALGGLGFAIPTSLLLWYHYRCFGSPWLTGYHVTETFAFHHQKGFLGLDRFRPEAFFGSFLAPDHGLLIFSPWLIFSAVGMKKLFSKHRGLAVSCTVVVAIYIVFVSSISMWRTHWQVGPRYITVMLPFCLLGYAAYVKDASNGRSVNRLAIFAAATLLVNVLLSGLSVWFFCVEAGLFLTAILLFFRDEKATLLAGAGGASIAVYLSSSVLFPHFPDRFPNPLREVTLQLILDNHAPPNMGSWLSHGTISLLPVFVVASILIWRWIFVPLQLNGRRAAVSVLLAVVWLTMIGNVAVGDAADRAAYRATVEGSFLP